MKAMKGFYHTDVFNGGKPDRRLDQATDPGSIIGMLILLFLLQVKIVKVETVDPAASALISVMVLFFHSWWREPDECLR